MTALISARSLSAGYGDATVIREVNLEVRAGEIVALLGRNGAGKSTTIRALSGMLRSTSGEVLWAGEPMRGPLHRRARAGLGLVTEERAVLMSLKVADNLRAARAQVATALDYFPELAEHMNRRAGLLSGGQQQMLALARVLARSPKVLLVDELSLGLAPILVERLLQVVCRAADAGVAVLIVEQRIHRILEVADRAYVLKRGRIALEAAASDLVDRVEDVQASYFSDSEG